MMTKTYGDISLESLRGQEYARPAPGLDKPSLEEPVLDLSFKKSPPASPRCELASKGSSPASPHRVASVSADFDSDRLRQQLENNNNDNKHVNNYQQQQQPTTRSPSREAAPAVVRTPPLQQAQTHRQYQHQPQEDTSGYSSSSVESLRRYSLTPPSDCESHKKLKLHHEPQQPQTTTLYSSLGGSLLVQSTSPQQQPLYPVFPLTPAMPGCIPMSAVSPTLLSPTIAGVSHQQQQQQMRPTSLEGLQFPTSSSSSSVQGDEQKRAPRPFKAYPKDPLSLSMGPDVLFDQEQKKAYSDFRSRMLDSVKRTSEGTNVKMRRTSVNGGGKSPQPTATSTDDERDAAYWERRRKNNEAAKRSRDARRAKEDEIAIRAAFLEQEYIRLKYENAILRDENTKFKCLLYGR